MIGYKDREALTADQIARIFAHRKPSHVTVILTPDESNPPRKPAVVLPVPDQVVSCQPDGHLLRPVSASIGGFLPRHTVAYSCGRFTTDGHPLVHRHDPAELARCRQLATEATDRLNAPWRGEEEIPYGTEEPAPPGRPYFATAVTGEAVPVEIDEALIRTLFGGTIAPNVFIHLTPLEQRRGKWPPLLGSNIDPSRYEELLEACDTFGRWFHEVEGLRDHSFVEIGVSEGDPGAVKPRLIVALTSAGSLVGVASYVVQA